jgi:cytidylate kinase
VIERVVGELADQGNAVIVGHAAQWTLKDQPGVLRVLVHGSVPQRAARLAEEQNIDLKRAETLVKQSDKDRSELLKRVYHFDWLSANMYDLTVNTDRLDIDFATDMVLAAVNETSAGD